MKNLAVFVFLSIFLISSPLFAQDEGKIVKIEVTGNERVDTGVVLNSIKTKINDPYDINKLREDLKNIYKTGFFSDVQIDVQDADGDKSVTFIVIERPPIKGIFVSGNKNIKTDDLKDKLKIQSGTVLNTEKVKESMDEIRKFYASKGYYGTKIDYEIDYGEGYEVAVSFIIEEPKKAFVKKIDFRGNKAFKASTLKKYMKTSEKGFFSWFTGSGILDEEALEGDKRMIEAFYADNGYVKAKVGTPDITFSKEQTAITIVFPIEEGDIYKIGALGFTGDVLGPKDDLLEKIKSKSGNTFRASLFQQDIMTLTDICQDQGYAFCEVTPLTLVDDNTKKMDITFDVTRGSAIFFNRINILGNTKTRDKVIRRELKFAEGDLFSASKLKESQRRLKNTTYFNNVDMKVVKTDEPDKVNMDISVEEKETGSINLGVGYSTTDNVIVSGSISQDNLFGTGRKLSLMASIGGTYNDFNIRYVEPHVFDRNVDAILSAFNFKRYLDAYDYRKKGGGLSLVRPMTDYVNLSVGYRYETIDVTNVDIDAPAYIKEQEGTSSTSAVHVTLSRNTIDDILNPTKGMNAAITSEIAGGALGGKNKFYKVVGFYGRYIPAGFWDSTFFLKGTAGLIRSYGGEEVPIYEKFFVGGITTVRGFKYGEAGPKDESDDPVGSKNELYFNLEWIFPIYKPAGVKGVIFYDFGSGFDDSKGWLFNGLRSAAGFGIRWLSPMGPIRLELGFNLSPKKGEKTNVFDFTIGTQY